MLKIKDDVDLKETEKGVYKCEHATTKQLSWYATIKQLSWKDLREEMENVKNKRCKI